MKAKVTIDGKEHEITLTEEQIKQVKNSSWKDEYRNKYIVRSDIGHISIANSVKVKADSFLFQQDCVCKFYEKAKLLLNMTQFALLRNDRWESNWGCSSQSKYGICNMGKEVFIATNSCYEQNHFVFGIAVRSREIANEMLNIFEEDIIKYY